MSDVRPTRLLRNSLRANAAFSAVSGLASLSAAGTLADFIGVPSPEPVLAVGVHLLLFAGLLVFLASRAALSVAIVIAVVAADIGWVLATLGVIYVDLFTRAGAALALAIASIVLSFALLQWLGLRRAPIV